MKKIYCDVSKCLGCKSCEIACAVEHSKSKALFSAIKENPLPVKRRKVQSADKIIISTACHHCEDAACINACMSGAFYRAPDGAVQHDDEKCIGCWMCVMVCPFGAISRQKNMAFKCDLCKDSIEGPVCVISCPAKLLKIKEV